MYGSQMRHPHPPPPSTGVAVGATASASGAPGRTSWLPRRLRPPALLRLTRRPALTLSWGGQPSETAAAGTDWSGEGGRAARAAPTTAGGPCSSAASKPATASAAVATTAAAAGGPVTSASASCPAADVAIIVALSEAPAYLHRPAILSGYRVGGTALSALSALFTPHNEAGNVWTMLIGLVMATSLYRSAAATLGEAAPGSLPPLAAALPCSPLLPFRLLYTAVAAHNPASVGLHLWIGRGAGYRRAWRSADVALIQVASVTLAVALGMPLVAELGGVTGATGPGGWTWWWWAWLAAVAALFAFNVVSTMVIRRVWMISKARLTRDMAVLVVCYLGPLVAHAAWWAASGAAGDGAPVPSPAAAREAAACGLAAVAAVGLGGLLYAKHWPEVFAPGRFDILGHSHQWMHVGAFVAHYAEWRFLAALLLPRPGGEA